ncbi:MAG TPA: glycosyltransferase family 39 protein [Anaerolineae bacterium]|nr:glycosyltransferase family 39 protein [Anaerolineae bacterium]
MLNRVRRIAPLSWMVALLLAATFLRFVAWQAVPPGMRYDEMTVVYEADEIRAGARPIYMDGSAEEALFHYLFAAAQDFIAPHLFTLRWLSAACGLIGIAALYTLGHLMFNRRVGLLAATIATVAFWSLLYSRLGLRIIALTPFVLVAMIFLWRGFTRTHRRDFIISGVLFGLSAYTYSATRMLPVAFVGFAIILAIFNRPFLRQHGLNFALTILTAALIVLPMAYHIATVPAAERRLGEVEGPLDALARGEIQPLINSTLVTAGMFIASGDPEWLYNIPNRPVFDLLTGAIFFIAVILSLRRLRQPAYALVLLWLLAGLLPAMLTWPAASNSHSFLAQTPAFLLAAIGLDAVASRWPKYDGTIIAVVLIVLTTVSLYDYFDRWATDDTVRREHQAGVAQIARQIDQLPSDHPIVFSSGAVMHWNPWSATVFRLTAPIGYTATRWFDARSDFIFPRGQTDLTLINAALDDQSAPLDSRLIEDLFPVVEPLPTGGDVYSATHLVSSLNTRLITLTQAEVSWPLGAPGATLSQSVSLPVAFADRLELIGYEVRKPIVEPGKNIRLTTYWRALDRGVEPLSFFVHVLDEQGNIAAQWDGYNYSPYYVQPGDIIVQVHFIPIPVNFTEGTYRLQLGIYQSLTGERIPIVVDGHAVSDRIWLQTIAVHK